MVKVSATQLGLRPVSAVSLSCKICSGTADLYGVVDMQRPCQLPKDRRHSLSGVPIYYRRCADCGFLFTDAFDDWGLEQFKTHIYNDDYVAFDPDYQTRRPTLNAATVSNLWAPHKSGMRVLDFGGGNDVFCASLRADGFSQAVTYDPLVPAHSRVPDGKFDLVTSFETLEHLPDPLDGIGKIAEFVAEPGAVFYSTMTLPDDFENHGLSWWYVGPRNGHISIFSKQALARAWGRYGFQTVSLNQIAHLAFRTLPKSWGLTNLQN